MSIIAISGKKQSGKDTIGNIIKYLTSKSRVYPFDLEIGYDSSPFVIKKFADKVKDIVCMLIGCSRADLENEDFKNTLLGPEWSMTVRQMLQKVGTDAMRDGLHPNVWVNALMSDYKYPKLSQYDPSYWIITDCRFPNEAEAVKNNQGIIIRVNSKRCKNDDNHPSETALDDYNEFDYIIDNDGSIEELVEKVKQILIKERLA